MSDRAREELGILASLTAAIETTQTDITNIDIQVQEDICRGNVRMSIPLNEVTRLEHARVEMDQAKLTETRLQVDLGIEIEMTDTNASDTSQSVTRNYGEGRTDLTAGQERDTAADQSAQRPRSDGKDESTGKSHSGNGYQDRTTTRRSFSNSDTDTSTKGNDTSQDPSGQPAKTEPEVDDSAASEMVSEDDRARYRDPEKLAAVYDENATFNEMKRSARRRGDGTDRPQVYDRVWHP